jgi:hypothetical protein
VARAVLPVLLLVALPYRASADAPARVALEWTRPAGCIERDALAHDVEKRLHRAAFVPRAQADLVVEGRVDRTDAGWTARIVLERPDGAAIGTRRIDAAAEACGALDEPLAVVLALLVDMPRDDPRLQPPPPPPKPWRLFGEADARGAAGFLPVPSVAARVGLEAEPPWLFPLEAEALAWLPREADSAGGRVSLWALGAGLGAAPLAIRAGRFVLRSRAAIEASVLFARGERLARTARGRAFEVRATVRETAEVPIGRRFLVRAGAGAGMPFVRRYFYFVDRDGATRVLYRVPPVAAILELGLAVRFR